MKLDPEAFRVKPGEKFICTFRRKSSGNVSWSPQRGNSAFCSRRRWDWKNKGKDILEDTGAEDTGSKGESSADKNDSDAPEITVK